MTKFESAEGVICPKCGIRLVYIRSGSVSFILQHPRSSFNQCAYSEKKYKPLELELEEI